MGAIKFRNVFLKEHHRRCMDVFNIIQDRIKLIISINVSPSNCQVLCLIYIEKLGHHLFLLKPDINYLQQYTRGLWWSNSAARLWFSLWGRRCCCFRARYVFTLIWSFELFVQKLCKSNSGLSDTFRLQHSQNISRNIVFRLRV